MDATALTVVGTGVALFVALWKVQGNRFDAVDKRFDMAEKLNRERFEMAEKLNRERFDMAETQNRERFEATLDGPAVDGTLRHGRKREP